MKKFLALLITLVLLTSALFSCNIVGGGDETPDDGPTAIVPDEDGWMGNWERPDIEDIEPAKCQQACNVCGKCLGNYNEPSCESADKCTDGEHTKYVFNVNDSKVEFEGLKIEQTWIGGLDVNSVGVITFAVNSSKEAVVKFGISVSKRGVSNIANNTPITINGERLRSRGGQTGTGTDWYAFNNVWLGCVTLKEGVNVITISNPNGNGAYNIKDFTFLSDAELTLVEVPKHKCESQSANGLCTNYECNEKACMNKEESGWKNLVIEGGDARVEKYAIDMSNSEKVDIWNAEEGVIGKLANGSAEGVKNQTVIWAFTATEETWVRISLNTSTYYGNSAYSLMYNITLNGEDVVTYTNSGDSGKSGKHEGWFEFVDSNVAYVKVSAGKNILKFVHTSVKQGDNIKYMTLHYASGVLATTTVIDEADIIPVTGVTLSASNTTLKIADSVQLTATVAPENATYKNVSFASSNPAVAIVNNNGLVQAIGEGKATITVYAGDGTITDSVEITVVKPNDTFYFEGEDAAWGSGSRGDIVISPEESGNALNGHYIGEINENMGASLTFNITADKAGSAVMYLSLARPATLNNPFTMTVNGESVSVPTQLSGTGGWATFVEFKFATIDLKAGNNVIVLTVTGGCGNFDYMKLVSDSTLSLTGNDIPVSKVELSGDNTLKVGNTLQLSATVVPGNATNKKVVYSSSDNSIATVDENGVVTGLKAGKVTITATAEGTTVSASIEIRVANNVPQDFYFEGHEAVPVEGTGSKPLAMPHPTETSESALNGNFVGEINQNFGAKLVFVINASEAATADVYFNIASPYADSNVFDITVNGEVVNYSASLSKTGWGTFQEYKFATIQLKEGKNVIVITVARGSCGNFDYMRLNSLAELSWAERVQPESVTLSADKTTITEVGKAQLTATVSPDADVKYVNYSSSDTTVATVDLNGLVTALKPGTVTITATTADGKKTGSIEITITEVVLTDYYFEGEDAAWTDGSMGAIAMAGAGDIGNAKNGTALGNVNLNKGATLTYKVNAAEDTTAKLFLNLAFGSKNVSNLFTIAVNGQSVDVVTSFSTGTANWKTYSEFYFATVNLNEGENVIVLTVTGSCGNYDYIKLASAAEVTLISKQ